MSTWLANIRTSVRQFFNKTHPLAAMVTKWKHDIDIRTETFESAMEHGIPGEPLVITYKIDGEGSAFRYKDEGIEIVSREGRVRTELPVEEEMARLLEDYVEVTGFGELYAVDEAGKMLPYPQAITILRRPEGRENQIRFAVYDLASVDGKPVEEADYAAKHKLITEIFGTGKLVIPIPAKIGDMSTIKEMWESGVLPGNYEGLVVYGDRVTKIKPIITQDLAVISVNMSDKHPELMGSLGVAYMDEQHNLHYAGHVGTGFSQADRAWWADYGQKNKLRQEKNVIFVKPELVIEVHTKELNQHDAPLFDQSLEYIGMAPSGIGREPRFIQIRQDKTISPADLRLDQIPGFERKSKMLQHPDTRVIPPTDKNPHGFTEQEVWDYYDAVKDKIVPLLQGYDVLLKKALPTGFMILRHDPKTGAPIRINSVEDFDRFNDGRVVEWHRCVGTETTIGWVDLDPKPKFPREELQKLTEALYEGLAKNFENDRVEVVYSGGRGFHVYLYMANPVATDTLRQSLKKYLDENIVPEFPKTTTSLSREQDTCRLDVSTLHRGGSLRVPWSLNATTGDTARPITAAAKVDAPLIWDPNSTVNEGRWRLRDPKEFDQSTFRRWTKWGGVTAPPGVTFIVGDLLSGGKAVQTIRFDKAVYDEKTANQFWQTIKDRPGFQKRWAWPVRQALLALNPTEIEGNKNVDLQALRESILAELDAINLYEQLADKVADKTLRQTLLDVAKEEKTHVGEFQAILTKLDPEFARELAEGAKEVADVAGKSAAEKPRQSFEVQTNVRVIKAGQSEKHEYACLMADITDALKERILAWNFANIPDADLYTEEGHGRELKPHVTLKYGLLDEDPEMFFKDLPNKPITFTLGAVSRFDTNPEYDVLKIDVTSPELSELHKLISDKYPNEDSFPEYQPHLTLAYVKKGAGKQVEGNTSFDNIADKFVTVLFTNKNNDMFKKHLDAAVQWNFSLTPEYKLPYYIGPISRESMSNIEARIRKWGENYADEFFTEHQAQFKTMVTDYEDPDKAESLIAAYVAKHYNPSRDAGKMTEIIGLPGAAETYENGFQGRLEKLIEENVWQPSH